MVEETSPAPDLPARPAAARRLLRRTELYRNLPNLITLARLFAVPLTLWLILHERYGAAFWVFVAAGLSDALDGYLAKSWNCRTPLGAVLDPAADKALIVGVYLTLGMEGQFPVWLVVLVLSRDFLIVLGFVIIQATATRAAIGPIFVSKVNTLIQLALITFVLAQLGLGIQADAIKRLLVGMAGVTTVLSGVAYLVRSARARPSSEAAL